MIAQPDFVAILSSVFKRQHSELLAPVSGAFGKDADGDAIFNIVNCLENCLEPFFRVRPVEEETVQASHPGGKSGIFLHFLLRNITGWPFASAVGQKNIKIAAMVADKQNRLIRYIFLADHGRFYTGYAKDHLETIPQRVQGMSGSEIKLQK